MSISNFLNENQVVFLKGNTRDEVINELIDNLDSKGKLPDKALFHQAILEREKIVSTGIGMGVAIPHSKLQGYEHFFIALGIHREGIDWQSLDGDPVHLVFMIGGPDQQQTQYLQLLSNLTSVIKDETLRQHLLKASTSEEVMKRIKSESTQ